MSELKPSGVFGSKPIVTPLEAAHQYVDLYRAVGVEEYQDIIEQGKFRCVEGHTSVKYFGRNLKETIDFANKDINLHAVAVFQTRIKKTVLDELGDTTPLDINIFPSGTVVIHQEDMDVFYLNSTKPKWAY
jgi:hypothetical protein